MKLQKIIGTSLLVSGTALLPASCAVRCSVKNIEGDGIEPGQTLTSKLLGMERGFECSRHYVAPDGTECSASGMAAGTSWCCNEVASIRYGNEEYRPAQTFKEKVAAHSGYGELALALGMIVGGLALSYRSREKYQDWKIPQDK